MSAPAEDLLSSCIIKIMGTRIAAEEPAFLVAVMTRIARYTAEAQNIELYCTPRRADGWLEWIIRVQYNEKRGITIGAIQRRAEDDVEYHS